MPIKLRRIDWSFDEWIAGTLGMTLEEEGLYCRIVNRIYSRGEALPDDPAEVARLCGLRPQQVRRLLPKLRGKFDETPGKLRSNRCETEMKLARNRLESARLNGAKGGKSRHLAEPGGSARVKAITNHQPVGKKGLSLKKLNPVLSYAPAGSPPLPSQGDGGAPAGATTSEAAASSDALIDPAEKAAALAELHRALDAARSSTANLKDYAGAAE